jgi:hypothetical protein
MSPTSRDRGRNALAGALLAALLALITSCSAGGGDEDWASKCPDTALTCGPGTAPPTASGPSAGGTTTGQATTPPSGTAGSAATAGPSGASTKPRAAGACASPRACGFPDASTTGPRIPMRRHDTGAMSIRTDGQVIRGWDITGSLDVYANDVTVIDSRITSTNWWGINLRSGFHGLRILHTVITAVPGKGPDNGGEDYAVSNMGGSSIEVGWCDVSVYGDALSMGQGNLHDNYVHDITPFRNLGGEWQHTDAVISNGGNSGHLIIRHNTLLNPTGVSQGASASIGLFSDTGVVKNVTVDHNWLAGGAYALYGGGTGATGIQVTRNVFSKQYHSASGGYGVVAAWNAAGTGNVWRDNRMSDGTPIFPEAS